MTDLFLRNPAQFIESTRGFTLAQIEAIEAELLNAFGLSNIEVEHRFAPGVYYRTIVMPTASYIIGHEHTTEHANIITQGRAIVMIGDELKEVMAGDHFNSKPGIRKILFILDNCKWTTVHPTNETSIPKLEDQLIVKSQSHLRYLASHPVLVNEREAA